MRFWSYLGVAATCAVLIPVVAVVGGRLTSDGPVRVALIWAIALLMGSAVYASAAATNAVRRVR